MQKKSLLTGTYLYIWSVQQTTCLCLAPTKRAMPKARAATAVYLDTRKGTVLELPAVEIRLTKVQRWLPSQNTTQTIIK